MQSAFGGLRPKRILALALAALLLLTAAPAAAPASAEPAMVRVLLSTEGAGSLTVSVAGAYRLAETGVSFTGGKLTLRADGAAVTVTHSSLGEL